MLTINSVRDVIRDVLKIEMCRKVCFRLEKHECPAEAHLLFYVHMAQKCPIQKKAFSISTKSTFLIYGLLVVYLLVVVFIVLLKISSTFNIN